MPRSHFASYSLFALTFAATAGLVAADTNDWINVNYVLNQGDTANTADARQSILSQAGTSAKGGPWSVANMKGIVPPSGDVHDYLSWAPYHWPDCNWCSKGTKYFSNPYQDENSTDPGDDHSDDNGGSSFDHDDPYEDGGDDAPASAGPLALLALSNASILPRGPLHSAHHVGGHHRMTRRRRHVFDHGISAALRRDETSISRRAVDLPDDPPLPTDADAIPTLPTTSAPLPITSAQSSTTQPFAGTPAPAEAPARTTQTGKCTPSPTKSLAPSATWTTCPYEVRDGKRNPDVGMLPDSLSAVNMAESVAFNAVAFALRKTKTYSQTAADYVNAFFLASSTAMNPNMNYAQQVRGPGKAHQMGTFAGILDLRGLVKVVNAVQLLKAAGSSDWTAARDKAMTEWMKSYISWLEHSALGQETASKANNHLTFYVNQLVAAKMYVGDTKGAQTALKNYFSNQYKDQIAASGEQPFEAVRTRPYHYRAFNLEAMITNAKMGDQLGLNLWSAKSKYGATIQTAVDFAMGADPKGEDVSDLVPQVAAVAAAYGDPKGKYAAFLQKNAPKYTSEPFFFYDQPAAFPNSPGARSTLKHGRDIALVADSDADPADALATDTSTGVRMAGDALKAASEGDVPFECPAIFDSVEEVEIEPELFVTCDELRPYYEVEVPFGPGAL